MTIHARLLTRCAAAGLTLLSLPAQDAAPEAAAAARILDAMQATRVKAAADHPRAVLSGPCEFRLAVGNAEPTRGSWRLVQAGERFLHQSDFATLGKRAEGYDGETLWLIDPESGASVKKGAERAQRLRLHRVGLGAAWRDHYAGAEVVGEEEIEGVQCKKLRLTVKDADETETWYVDAERLLIMGQDLTMTLGGQPGMRARFRYADYKEKDGYPYTGRMTLSFGVVSIDYLTEAVELDSEIDDQQFAPPAGLQEQQSLAFEGGAADNAIRIIDVPERHVMSIRTKCKPADIGTNLAVTLPEVMRYLMASGVEATAPPFSRYHSAPAPGVAEVDIEAGIPVAKPMPAKERIKPRTLPAGKVAMAWHVGPYHDLSRVYQRLQKWMKDEGYTVAGAPWEVYWTDPGAEPDPAKWRTQVFWPVAKSGK